MVTAPSNGGLAQDVVGVFTNVGNMAFFVDIQTLMSLRKYPFGDGVPNKVHMTLPLHVSMLVQQELAKRQQDKTANDDSDWSEDSEGDSDQGEDVPCSMPLSGPPPPPQLSFNIHDIPLPSGSPQKETTAQPMLRDIAPPSKARL